jgi:hypothetical protein
VCNPQFGDNNDPDDPSGLLESTTWQGTVGFTQFQFMCHPLVQHFANTEAKTYRIYPLIVSAGPPDTIIASVALPAKGRLGLDKEPLGPPPAYALPPNNSSGEPPQYYFGVLAGPQGGFAANNIYPTLASPK